MSTTDSKDGIEYRRVNDPPPTFPCPKCGTEVSRILIGVAAPFCQKCGWKPELVDEDGTKPPELKELSAELIFLKEIYETRDRPLGFNDLCERLKSLGYSKDTWSKCWDMLEDQGMIDTPWMTRDGRTFHVFTVSHHVTEFARAISEHWREVVLGKRP
jgi:hypothetical protein